ncbi:MAG: hypothetical protein RR123_02250 [Clostridia bacterium]
MNYQGLICVSLLIVGITFCFFDDVLKKVKLTQIKAMFLLLVVLVLNLLPPVKTLNSTIYLGGFSFFILCLIGLFFVKANFAFNLLSIFLNVLMLIMLQLINEKMIMSNKFIEVQVLVLLLVNWLSTRGVLQNILCGVVSLYLFSLLSFALPFMRQDFLILGGGEQFYSVILFVFLVMLTYNVRFYYDEHKKERNLRKI